MLAPSGSFTLIDESYNANPASMRAALALLGETPVRLARPPHRRARRHARTWRAKRRRCIADLVAKAVAQQPVDLVYAAGPLMKHLFDALPRGAAWALGAERIRPISKRLLAVIAAGDVVMVKGSNGSRMGPVVKAIKARFAPAADRQVRNAMLYWLADLSHVFSPLNLFR